MSILSVALHHRGSRVSGRSAERRVVGGKVRRIALGTFFASVVVNAALGIYAVLSPEFGDTQGRILGTSLCVTGAILLSLACEPAWERRVLGPAPYAGSLLGTLGFALAVGAIWAEPASDTYGKITGSTFTIAAACVVASLLALGRLVPRHVWAFEVTLVLLALGAALVTLVWWIEDLPELYARGMGVVLIALAAFVVTVPVLHWIDRSAIAVSEATAGAVRFCPYCGRRIAGGLRPETSCAQCGREFSVIPVAPSTPASRST